MSEDLPQRLIHRPLLEPVLAPKYEDDPELGHSVLDWDGTVRLACTCGWRDSRVSLAAPDSLARIWRDHVTAFMAGLKQRGPQA